MTNPKSHPKATADQQLFTGASEDSARGAKPRKKQLLKTLLQQLSGIRPFWQRLITWVQLIQPALLHTSRGGHFTFISIKMVTRVKQRGSGNALNAASEGAECVTQSDRCFHADNCPCYKASSYM